MTTPQNTYNGERTNTSRLSLEVIVVLVILASAIVVGCNKNTPPAGATPATTSVGNEIDDTVITTRLKATLLGDPDTKGFDIKVETRKGIVQLSGFVNSQVAIDRALSIARRVEGVKGVESGMTIKEGRVTAGNEVDDSIVTTRVKSALLTDTMIKSFDIAVVTRKGSVQLSGFVDSEAQIRRAVDIATRTKDVQSVVNELKVKK